MANGIRYCEEALALDPKLELARYALIRAYLDLEDLPAAERLVGQEGDEPTSRLIPVLLYRQDWQGAGEAAYRALERRTTGAMGRPLACAAIRMHARTTGDYARAEAALEAESGVVWDAVGNATLSAKGVPTREDAIALADVLLASGQEQKGRALLATILGRMRQELKAGRSERWYHTHRVALALNGETDAALAMIERGMETTRFMHNHWYDLEDEPAYAPLRNDPRFKAIRSKAQGLVETQRRELERLRTEGLVPDRSHGAQASS